jgi:putative flippase GtrA
VFQAGNVRLGRTIAAYLAVNGVGAGLTVLVAVLAARGLSAIGLPVVPAEGIAHAIGIALAAVFNFIAHKHWTFKGR